MCYQAIERLGFLTISNQNKVRFQWQNKTMRLYISSPYQILFFEILLSSELPKSETIQQVCEVEQVLTESTAAALGVSAYDYEMHSMGTTSGLSDPNKTTWPTFLSSGDFSGLPYHLVDTCVRCEWFLLCGILGWDSTSACSGHDHLCLVNSSLWVPACCHLHVERVCS